MIVNSSNTDEHVKFVSYDGKWPNLCSGTLHLVIDGKDYFFGNSKPNERFWDSGGRCGFRNGYSESYVEHGEWIINADKLPEEIRQYAREIDEVFNENVQEGCCGGCI